MSLSAYKKKRTFDKTPEPSGKQVSSAKPLRFVVQKHDATRLHYDFRLEMEGVLKSWAVPKGPSLNPKDKRLAMMVEDHPYDYRNFEGIIPKGNYGAGTVIVWDEGTYEPAEPVKGNKKQVEKFLLQQLEKGNLKIKLNGEKLKGEFVLVHTNDRSAENAWLLIKKQDEFAELTDVTKKDKSVVSGLTIEQVSKTSTNEWQSNRSSKKTDPVKDPKTKSKKTAKSSGELSSSEAETDETRLEEHLKHGKPAPVPENLKPMFATLSEKPFDDPDWLFEVKWDGYRAIATIQDGEVELQSRNNISFKTKFREVTAALQAWKINAVVDGEIITLNEKGAPEFQLLQAWQKNGKGTLVYYLFDILWLEGYSLMHLPLTERKEILKKLVPEENIIKYSDHIVEAGKDFFTLALQEGLEGIMAKKADSTYHPAVRTQQWLKIKTHQTQEAVIAGFTKGRGGRKLFGALILGIYDNGEFVYIGHTGSGLNDKSLVDVYKKLQPLITEKCPFKVKPKTNMEATWVEPKLVCEVKFQEWTNDNALRIPIFLHLREDKKAVDVKKEESIDPEEAVKEIKKAAKPKKAQEKESISKTPAAKKSIPVKSAGSTDALLDKKDKEKTVVINGRELKFTNLDKYYWPREKCTKRDMLNYYHRIIPYLLPYMKDRPQSLNRFPDGITGMSFYQKDVAGKVADWLTTYTYVSDSDGEAKDFLVCSDEASLLYIANLGCIEVNPWHSRTVSPDRPDWCVIDLDPDEISFDKVIETANVVKKILDALEINSYCKTSGSTGLHIYIPLGAKYSYDQSRQLAELIVNLVHPEISEFTSLERNPAKRRGKIYLDYLQNRSIQTIAAPYSLRPKEGATVSTPLHWEEVKKGLSIASFTMLNIFDRLKNEGDLFKPVLGKGIDINKVLKKASTLL